MKKTASQLLILFFVLFTAFNIFLNRELRPLVKKYAPGVDYIMAVSVIPDRAVLVGFSNGNLEAPLLMIDLNVTNILKKQYDKALDGIIAYGLKVRFVKRAGEALPQPAGNRPFVIPYCTYFYIFNSSIEFEDQVQNYRFFISGINGLSKYQGTQKSSEYLTLDCSGNILGKLGQKVYLKLYFYPNYTNKFFLNFFATGINPKIFEPMFVKNRIKFDSGRINMIIQMKGEMRRIYVNNIIQFEQVKVRQDGLDLKALLGLSVEQLVDFLKDSKGDFYINFNFDINDADFGNIMKYYGDAFKGSLTDRVKLGVITAPLRQVKDLIWNLTGENVVRFFKLFGGN
jgi:hypothetical protein